MRCLQSALKGVFRISWNTKRTPKFLTAGSLKIFVIDSIKFDPVAAAAVP